MDIKAKIYEAQAVISKAKNDFYEAQREAERIRDAATSSSEKFIRGLEERYKELAEELAEEYAPFSRYGNRLSPDEAKATPEGMKLMWDAEYHYDIKYHTISWEELQHAEAEQEMQKHETIEIVL